MSFQMTVGHARIRQLTELAHWPFPAEGLFPNVTAQQVDVAAHDLGPAYIEEESLNLVLAIHTYVVELDGTTIVVDTGNGNGRDRPNLLPHHMFATGYLQTLEAAVDLRDVLTVINTHLHPDHCGWNTQRVGDAWVPTFPNATYLFADGELAALRELTTSGAANGIEEDLVRMFDDSIRPVLEGSRWETFAGERVLAQFDGTSVVAVASPGHTVGHSCIEVRSGTECVVLSGDIIHHPIQLANPDLSSGGDSDTASARQTRAELLARCAAGEITLLPSHFPVKGSVRIGADGHLLRDRDEAFRVG